MVPKVEDAAQLHFIDHLLTQLETEHGIEHRIGIEAQIENARGAINLREIATGHRPDRDADLRPRRLRRQHRRRPARDRLDRPRLPGRPVALRALEDRDHRPRLRRCRRSTARTPTSRTPTSTARLCHRARLVGFDGKWVLHPGQVDIANEVFMPTQDQFDEARRLLDAYHHATHVERKGAVMHEGQMIDEASRKIAEPVVARGEAAGMARPGPAVSLPLDELTERAARDRRAGAPVHRRADHPGRLRATSATTSSPTRSWTGLSELGIFGFTIPEEYGGLGLDLTTYALAVCELLAGLDERLGHHQHPLHRRQHADARRHRRAEAAASCRGWRPARSAAPSR